MPRPCEDVIVISDAEEGELLEVDDDVDVPEDSDREEGEIPDDDMNARTTPRAVTPCQDQIVTSKRNRMKINSMPISFDKPLITHTKFKYRVYRVATNGFKYSQERYSNRVKKTYLQSKYHVTPEAKIRRKCQKMDESSDSDTERIVKTRKLASLGISRKSHSSLQSRLSNMLKYSEILSKPRNLKNGINVNKENRLECDNSENLEEGKDDQITSNSIDNSSDAMKNDDLSDDNLDILRELALKSKTQRVPKPDESDNHKNDDIIENSDLRSKDVDKELEELRLDALKSAMLKKAFKRKRIKNDKKDKKSNDLNDKQIDISQTALSPISLESNVGNLMYDYSNSNFEYYSYINPRVYYDLDKVAETGTVDSNNANKENTESRETHKPDDEDEESLRNRLLLMLKSKKEKQPDLPHEIPCPKVNIKHDDSSLIIKLGGSDTESECEETKNLALMHDKILNQNEFQRNLEYYLKEARQTALDKMSYDSSKFNNGISRDGEEAHMVEKNQLLNHLAKLELARKEALKKSVEIRKLQKKPLLQRKFSISSQSGDLGIKKDSKRILKPSMLINRRPSISIADKILSTRVNNGQRALEQQLIFIRKKIAHQNQTLKQTQNQMKRLQKKKEVLNAQIHSAMLTLKATESAITSGQQSLQKTFQNLTLLQKHHLMLQNRCLKNSSKIDVESTPLINNNIKENKITHQIPSIQNIKDTEKVKISNIPNTISTILIEKSVVKDTKITKISNVPDTKSTILIEKTIPKDQSQSVNDSTVTLNSSKESDISSNKENTSSEESPMPITNVDSDKAIDTQLILLSPLQNDKTEKSVVSFTEYETPLMGMKSNHSWIGDPHAILCPFDVSGCCKDASCNYYHPKICKM